MKKLLLASTALTLSGQAFAADMPIKAPRMAEPVAYSWSSCYVGGHVGAGRSHANFVDRNIDIGGGPSQTIAPPGGSVNVDGFGGLGGVQLGCDYQFAGNWVVGFAGDLSWANIRGETRDPFFNGKNGNPLRLTAKTNEIASATGRIGYASGGVLAYVKGGAAWTHDRYSIENLSLLGGTFCLTGPPFAFSSCNPTTSTTRTGWTAGGGIEWAFASNWSAMIEYDHYGFGAKTLAFYDANIGNARPALIDIKQNIDVVKIGLNYRFAVFGN